MMEVDVYPSIVAETTTCTLPQEPLSASSARVIALKTHIVLLKKRIDSCQRHTIASLPKI